MSSCDHRVNNQERNIVHFLFYYFRKEPLFSTSSSANMTDISGLPPEVLLHIFTFLPSSDLTRVQEVCPESKQWRDLSKTALTTRIQSSWPNPGYWPIAGEVRCAAALVTSGYLPEDVMTTLAARIQDSWPNPTPAIQGHRVQGAKNL